VTHGADRSGRRHQSAESWHGTPRQPDGQTGPRRPEPATNGSSFTEIVDGRTGSIRARGHLTRQAADMLRGTVDALRRSGHTRIVLDLGGVQAVDDAGLHAVRSLQDRTHAAGGHLTVLDAPAPHPD